MQRALIAAAVAVGAALFAAPAHASSVYLTHAQGGDLQTLHYAASPGENNEVTITINGASNYVGWLVTDNGAPLDARYGGCTQIDAHTASCPLPSEANIAVEANLGDGNDYATLASACGPIDEETDHPCAGVTAHGGDGIDIIFGSDVAPSKLYGEDGDDQLLAGENGSICDGGSGDDWLIGAGGPDRLLGRSGDDRIDGHAGNDVIRGHSGDDDLHGGYGVDTVNGESGRDKIVGGADGDRLYAGDGTRDHVDGSSGHDRANVDSHDAVTSVEHRY